MGKKVGLVLAILALSACGEGAPPRAPLPPPTDGGLETPPTGAPDPNQSSTPAFAPPLSGGNLLALRDGRLAAAHPATHALVIADPSGTVTATIDLGEDAQPGRMAEDAGGMIHVLRRDAGELLTIDPNEGSVVDRRDVCAAPRGLAYDEARDAVWIACAGGELLSLPASQGGPTVDVQLGPDLRDVVIGDGLVYVSRFRTAELLSVALDGSVLAVRHPSAQSESDGSGGSVQLTPNVAYRLRALPDGGVAMLHQLSVTASGGSAACASSTDASSDPGSGGSSSGSSSGSPYGGSSGSSGGSADPPSTPPPETANLPDGIGACGTGVVQSAITIFPPSGDPTESGPLASPVLAVDSAVSPDGERLYVASATVAEGGSGVRSYPRAHLGDPCLRSDGNAQTYPSLAVETLADGSVASLERDTDALHFTSPHLSNLRQIPLGQSISVPRGFVVFHAMTPSQLACASCHPGGGDDGHVWLLGSSLRTQSLLGGLLATAPFHWEGNQPDMAHVMHVTFHERMGGSATASDVGALSTWLNALPSVPGSVDDPDAVERGRNVFVREAHCADCHSGDALTNDRNVDVGTGCAFQVPSLRGVALRAPYFHDGCAPTLEAVLDGACGTAGHHGQSTGLTSAHRADLLAYLRSL